MPPIPPWKAMSQPDTEPEEADGSRWFQRTAGGRDWEDFYRSRWEHDN
ncbi:MAG: hypothetical protein ABEJ27_06930, partial [Halodesulfurarchaeum sp.]